MKLKKNEHIFKMKVILKNFKCHNEKIIEFSDNEFILLNGESGVGKSSILDAIYFCLTGQGRNIIMDQKNSCSVTIEYENIHITRSKRPNVLKVVKDDNIFEDSAAQSIINITFCKYFGLIGYLKQNKFENFVLLSPSEKLIFLEKLCFHNIDIFKIKNKAYELVKTNDKKFSSSISKMDMLEEQIENIPEQVKKIKAPLGEEKSQKVLEKYSKFLENIETIDTKTKSITECINELKLLNTKIETLDKTKSNYIDQQTDLDNEMKSLEKLEEIEKHIQENSLKLQQIKRSSKLKSLIEKTDSDIVRLEKAKEAEDQNKADKLEELKQNLWKGEDSETCLSRMNEIIEKVPKFKSYFKLKKQLDDLNYNHTDIDAEQTKLEKINKAIEHYKKVLQSFDIHKCPECNVDLLIKDNKIYSSTVKRCDNSGDKQTVEIKLKKFIAKQMKLRKHIDILKQNEMKHDILNKQIQSLDSKTKNSNIIQELDDELAELKQYMDENILAEKQIEKLEKKGYSFSILELEKEIDKNKDLILQMKQDNTNNLNLSVSQEDIQLELEKYREMKYKYSMLKKEFNKLNDLLGSVDEDIQEFENSKKGDSIDRKYRELNHYKLQKEKIITKKKKLDNVKQKIDEYNLYKPQIDNYKNMLCKFNNLTVQSKDEKDKLDSSHKLRTILSDSESVCLSNFIKNLQNSVQVYLDEFFVENAMILEINRLKETKKVSKPSINVVLNYKGRRCDIQTLSGGELQRVILAFELSLSNLFNVPFIMLDESLNNLNQDLTADIIESINKYRNNKLMIITGHQLVEGIFDEVINI